MNASLLRSIIHPDGRLVPYPPANGTKYTLEEMQQAVGGLIEIVPARESGFNLVVNEEGKLKLLKPNPVATSLSKLFPHDFIVGPALLIAEENVD